MKHVDVPFDKGLYKQTQRNYRKGRSHSEAFQLAAQVGVPLIGMGISEWLKSRERDRRASANQAFASANPDLGVNLPAGFEGDINPDVLVRGAMESRAQSARTRQEMSLLTAKLEAEHQWRQEDISAEDERQKSRDSAAMERLQMETGMKGTFEAFKPVALAVRQRLGLLTTSEQEDLANAEESRARARAYNEGRMGAGGGAMKRPVTDEEVDAAVRAYRSQGIDADPVLVRRQLEVDPTSTADPYGAQLRANAAKLSQRASLTGDLVRGAAGMGDTVDPAAIGGQVNSLMDQIYPPAPKAAPSVPYTPVPAEWGQATAGKPLPQGAVQDIMGLPPEHRQRAIQGFQARGFDVSPLQRGETDSFDTQLSPQEEQQFQMWKARYAPQDSGQDYDLRGAFKAGLTPDPKTGHWPDTYKKPNHPTFSIESKYASQAPDRAGRWNGETFIPPGSQQGPSSAPQRGMPMPATPGYNPYVPVGGAPPASQPASQPTGMMAPPVGVPQAAPQQPVFQPHEMAAIYQAGQSHGVPPQMIEAEIAKNPWGVRQQLDMHLQQMMSQPKAPVA